MAGDLTFTGARAKLTIRGKEIARAVDVSGSEGIQFATVEVLNNVQVYEHAPVGYLVTLRASQVYVFKSALKALDLFPKTLNDPEKHLASILGSDEIDVTIVDTYRNETFWIAQGCQIASKDFSFGARDIVVENVEFVVKRAFDYTDALGSSTP